MRPIYYAIFIVLALSSKLALSDEVRIYCYYVPKAFLDKAPNEQIKEAIPQNLLYQDVTQTPPTGKKPSNNYHIDAEYDETKKIYKTSEKEYFDLFEKCQTAVGDKGQMLELKVSVAKRYSWSPFAGHYRLEADLKEEAFVTKAGEKIPHDEILLPIDDKFLLKEGFSQSELKDLKIAFGEVEPGVFQKLYEKLKDSKLANAVGGITELAGNKYAQRALLVTAFLASLWFAGPAVAGAIDYLFPIVYAQLFGIPTGLSYYAVFLPAKYHAIAWGYSNSHLIVTSAAALVGLLAEGVRGLYEYASQAKPNIETIKQKLKEIANFFFRRRIDTTPAVTSPAG